MAPFGRSPTRSFTQRLVTPATSRQFGPTEVPDLPEPVRRYFTAAIAPGTPLAGSAELRMRGAIKLGTRWLPFRSSQVASPHRGFLWSGRVGRVIVGSDRYVDRTGGMDWRLLGLVPVAQAGGPDVARSAAGRAGAEAIWVPTALLPRDGVTWQAGAEGHLAATYRLDDTDLALRLTVDAGGRVESVVVDRWGDPDGAGDWHLAPFGFVTTRYATFGGVTIPVAGRAGWHFGTERWSEGEFFRCEITAYRLLGADDHGRRRWR